ncbi:MAG: hypothetical protein GX287_07505 [Fusobacteria bacterium]|nr:hypothetical protein [Fusobacteriota bacterium]
MKEYIIGQYYPYLVIGVYGIDFKVPDNLFESEIEEEIGKKCKEWYLKLKEKLGVKFMSNVNLTEVVSYTFKTFSSRDIVGMPYKIDSSLSIETELNQKYSDTKVAEFTVMIQIDESQIKEVLEYLLDNNYYYKENEDSEVNTFRMLGKKQ